MNNELYHYGVPGMKWGVHRALSKQASNVKLRKKALSFDSNYLCFNNITGFSFDNSCDLIIKCYDRSIFTCILSFGLL